MIASVIGRTFLEAFNNKYGFSLNAKEFFEQHYFPLFFDHPKYMQWITNSPFVQMEAGQKPHLLSKEERQGKMMKLHTKIADGKPEASIAIGFPASEEKEFASTSGLVSDIAVPAAMEEIYLSWIGGGLGLGVAGGYSIFFDQPDLLLTVFEGWPIYRKYLNDPAIERLRGNQINTWNGQWVSFIYNSRDYREDFDFSFLEQLQIFQSDPEKIEVNTVNWTRLFFAISQKLPDEDLTGYVYSLGQTNKTIGFVPFRFKSGIEIKTVYKKLFSPELRINTKDFEELFGLHIKRACELGNIGLQALRPERLKKYFGNEDNLNFKKEDGLILYHVFKTWLVVMLAKNKEEIGDYTQSIAEALHRYRKDGSTNVRKSLLEQTMFPAKTKKAFLEGLIDIVKDARQADLVIFKNLRDEVHLMTNEEYGYFVTLLKFDYAYQERNLKN